MSEPDAENMVFVHTAFSSVQVLVPRYVSCSDAEVSNKLLTSFCFLPVPASPACLTCSRVAFLARAYSRRLRLCNRRLRLGWLKLSGCGPADYDCVSE